MGILLISWDAPTEPCWQKSIAFDWWGFLNLWGGHKSTIHCCDWWRFSNLLRRHITTILCFGMWDYSSETSRSLVVRRLLYEPFDFLPCCRVHIAQVDCLRFLRSRYPEMSVLQVIEFLVWWVSSTTTIEHFWSLLIDKGTEHQLLLNSAGQAVPNGKWGSAEGFSF